jgi:hypothetical protein
MCVRLTGCHVPLGRRRACKYAEPHGTRAATERADRPPNGIHAKLRGQGLRGLHPSGRAVAAYTAGQRRTMCNRPDAERLVFGRGGSPAGPKPGRDSFSVKLDARCNTCDFESCGQRSI